jgi:hypothetical protein
VHHAHYTMNLLFTFLLTLNNSLDLDLAMNIHSAIEIKRTNKVNNTIISTIKITIIIDNTAIAATMSANLTLAQQVAQFRTFVSPLPTHASSSNTGDAQDAMSGSESPITTLDDGEPPLMKPDQIDRLPHVDDRNRGYYKKCLTELWDIVNTYPVDSAEYITAESKIRQATVRVMQLISSGRTVEGLSVPVSAKSKSPQKSSAPEASLLDLRASPKLALAKLRDRSC